MNMAVAYTITTVYRTSKKFDFLASTNYYV